MGTIHPNRLHYIDLAKGLGIWCIVLLHYENGIICSEVNKIIGTYMITVFYICTGWIMAIRDSRKSIREIINHRINTLGLVYLYWTLILLTFDFILYLVGYYDLFYLTKETYKSVVLRGIGTLWFIPSLIGGEIIWVFLKKKSTIKICLTTIIVLIIITLYWSLLKPNIHKIVDAPIYAIICSLNAFIHIMAGFLFYKYIWKKNPFRKIPTILLLLTSLFISSCLVIKGQTNYIFLNSICCFICSIFIPISILSLCSYCKNIKFLCFWGKNSLSLMVTHYSIVLVLFQIFNEYVQGIPSKDGIQGINGIIYFLLSIPIQFILTTIINKYCPLLVAPINSKFFYKISNADGKQWVMPSSNMSMGMQLYQPSAWKGKLLKKWFPIINKLDVFGMVKKNLHIEVCNSPISDKLKSKLYDVFGQRDLDVSVFNGTPSVHQKVTIQIYTNDKILGYCKVTGKPEIIEIFQREEAYLKWLYAKGVKGVPNCLFCQEIEDGDWIFVQSTNKSKHSKIRHELGDLELDFLKQLNEKTKLTMLFKDTEQYQWMSRLDAELCGSDNYCIIKKGVDIVNDYYSNSKSHVFSAYHSDFTPWNMYEENGELYVFDWEYAGRTYLPMLDAIHFMVQTCIFEKKMQADAIANFLLSHNILKKLYDNPKIAIVIYLLDIISKFSIRDRGYETKDTKVLMNTRIEILKRLL